jgi:hypothetical protein
MLQAISIAGMATDAFADFVVGHGELWSAQLFAAGARLQGYDAVFMDTRDVLVVTPTSDGASVDLDEAASNAKLDGWFAAHGAHKLVVATGFIARNPEGQATTLRRNGSDFSATILGALFRSGRITIWTDVDGVYSADPRKVPEADEWFTLTNEAGLLPVVGLWRDPLAWSVALFMGLQSALAFSVLGWLAPILRERGLDAATAGLVLSVLIVVQLATSLTVPSIATRMFDGLMSRCTSPCACAAASARATCSPSAPTTTASRGSRRSRTSRRLGPSTSSMTSQTTPSSRPVS